MNKIMNIVKSERFGHTLGFILIMGLIYGSLFVVGTIESSTH